MLLLLMKAMSQLNSQYQHAIEVDLRVFVDQVDLIINKDSELIERERSTGQLTLRIYSICIVYFLYTSIAKS